MLCNRKQLTATTVFSGIYRLFIEPHLKVIKLDLIF